MRGRTNPWWRPVVGVAPVAIVVALVVVVAGDGHRRAPSAPVASPAAAPPSMTSTTAPTTTTTTTATTAPPTTVAVATTAATATEIPVPVPGGGVAVGDSVLEDVALYAPGTLATRGVVFNAAVSRQWWTGEAILSSMLAAGRLPPEVIVALGTNGPITATDFDTMMRAARGAARVVFMTVTGPYVGNNPVIAAGVARYPQASLADWATLSAPHREWFARDGVHIGAAGAAALGALLASRL